jgi:hypothetical protein
MISLSAIGKGIVLPNFEPVLVITMWDAHSILWAYAHRLLRKRTVKQQVDYYKKSLETLANELIKMQPITKLRPTIVNVTLSKETSKRKGKVVECMFGASIRCPVPMNVEAAKSRVETMETLK